MQIADYEPRLLQRSRPLPFCPRPFPGEAVESWIWRIGQEFGYTPARFLRAIGCPSTDRKDPVQRLTQADIPYLATLARMSLQDLAEMEIIPRDWRLRAILDVPYCGQCWIESQRLHGFAYVQAAWMHAGRISCPHHGNWLFSARESSGARIAIRRTADNTACPPRSCKSFSTIRRMWRSALVARGLRMRASD